MLQPTYIAIHGSDIISNEVSTTYGSFTLRHVVILSDLYFDEAIHTNYKSFIV